jgi:ABC-2 type transport system ATP-binding protein
MSRPAAIKAVNLRKSFGAIAAVQGLSLEVSPGETLGLLGPNGAGKSTSIQILTGLLQPDSGSVEVAGGDPHDPAVRRRLGVAPQALSLYEELTATENLAFFGSLYQLSGSELRERITWGLAFAGLQDRARHRVRTFSGGMKRRLNLAVAMVHQPDVLFLDEPTVGVDPQSRNHIFESIAQLQSDGLTILYTTHYMEEARRLCNRVAIVDHGKLLAVDTVAALIAAYGGESQIQAEVTEWPAQLHSRAKVEAGILRANSPRPLEEIASWTASGARFTTLQVNSPDLESIFLRLTGRSLRD